MTESPWTVPDWQSRAGRVILDPLGPNGEPIGTPRDRRWLWRIETELAVSATTDTMRQLGADLGQYLRETCEHHWTEYHPVLGTPDAAIGPHRQCLWCSAVEDLPADPSAPTDTASSPVPQVEGVGGADTPPPAPPTPPECQIDGPHAAHDRFQVGGGAVTLSACPGRPAAAAPATMVLAGVVDGAIVQVGAGPASVPCGGEEDNLPRALGHVAGCSRCLNLLGWDK